MLITFLCLLNFYYTQNIPVRAVNLSSHRKVISAQPERVFIVMKSIDIIGKKYRKLTVIQELPPNRNGKIQVLCKCDCLNYCVTVKDSLRRGIKSCGCGENFTFGKSVTPEYKAWRGMRGRCTRAGDKKNYFDRGITVCDRWMKSFDNFLLDMGKKPSPSLTLDRINNDKGYYKENCRWATAKEQQNNTRSNVRIEYLGRVQTLTQWADEFNLGRLFLWARLKKMTIHEAITTPKHTKFRNSKAKP